MKKSKELRSRVEQRNRLLEAKGSKEFWKQVMIFEFDRLTQVLHDKAKVRNLATNVGLEMSVAMRHFEAISVPPVCAWFDDVFYDHIQRVIDASIEGLSGNLGCKWVSDDESSQGESYIDQDISDSIVRNANQKINKRISLDEYRTAKEKMHKGKTVGPDGIPIECILGVRCENTNQLVSPIDDIIVRVFNIILGSGQYPEAWRVALLRPLIKGSTLDTTNPNNYRGIALMSAMAKLFATVLEGRVTDFQWETNAVSSEQFGFTRCRRALDACFVLDTLIDYLNADNRELFVAFIDFQKAYDYVWRDGLFHKMLIGGMRGPIYRILHSMYKSVKSVVKCGNDISDVINQLVGLRQGCVLSPCLFSLFIADLPSFLADEGCQGVPLHDTWVRVLLYADDGALTASSAADLQRMLDALWQYCRRWRMIVNVKKTEIVVFNRKKPSVREYRFNYNNETITIVEKFKYLGVMFHEKRKYAISIEYRLSQAKRLIAAWVRRCRIWLFKPDVVVNQFMTCILPALEYGVAL